MTRAIRTISPTGDLNRMSVWQPKVGASWQIILLKPIEIDASGKVTSDVDIYDLGLYDNEASTLAALRDAGKKVICYQCWILGGLAR